METRESQLIIEALLFASGEPVKISKLAKITGQSKEDVEAAIAELQGKYAGEKRGIFVMRKEDEAQMGTNPEYASFIDQFVKSELQESLSQAGLEVLSIVAYRGPITRASIEAIRGVNCSYTLRNLLMRGLIERIGNPNDARGYVYKISFDFLKKLGIENAGALPDYETLSKDERVESIIQSQEKQ